MKDSGIEWIGEIPESWNIQKCKYILMLNDGGVWGDDPIGDDTDKTVIRSTEQTVDGRWCIEYPAKRNLQKISYSSARIKKDDLLITKSSGSDLHIGKTTIADDYFEINECYFSNFIQRIRCKEYTPRLLWYLFNSTIIREQCVFLQNTTSGIGNINADIIDNLIVPAPPLPEQQAISAYLDNQCAHIDNIIEKTKASIEEYKKLRQAVITQAVTKGVRGDRAMKNSGIEWIGEIPQEWEISKFKYLGRFVNGYAFPSSSFTSSGVRVMKISNIQPMNVVWEEESFVGEEYLKLTDYLVENGDLVFALTRPIINGGIKVAIADNTEKVLLNQRNAMFKGQKRISTKWQYYLMQNSMFIQEFELFIDGTGQQPNISTNEISIIPIPLPCMKEQEEITDYLDQKCTEIDSLITKKEQFLTELESYKKSMIYEYVTGKKEVPTA